MDFLKKLKLALSVLLCFYLVSIYAIADSIGEPSDMQGAFAQLKPLFEAFQAKNWAMVGAILIMLLVYVLRNFVLKKFNLSSNVLALVSAAMGSLVAVGSSLALGKPVLDSLVSGVFMGAAASGLWSLVGKLVLGQKDDAAKDLATAVAK